MLANFFIYKVRVTVEHRLLTSYIHSHTPTESDRGVVSLATRVAPCLFHKVFRFLYNMVHK
jgi:hypothetical protein